MSEEKITIEIDETTGEISVVVNGIKGQVCVKEVEKLIGNLAMTLEETHTEEYYQEPEVRQILKSKNQIKQESKK